MSLDLPLPSMMTRDDGLGMLPGCEASAFAASEPVPARAKWLLNGLAHAAATPDGARGGVGDPPVHRALHR